MLKYCLKLVLVNSLVLGLMLCLAETALFLSYRFPPSSLIKIARRYNLYHDRNELSYMKDCARHDSRLSYLLKPGSCQFGNQEYSTEVEVNSAGFRDDEGSLDSPELIAMGDSQTTGWGVAQSESYPNVLEELTGLKVLNSGIPSFGTARELLALNHFDLSQVKYLTIQYCNNDLRENKEFVSSNGKLRIMRAQDYIAIRSRRKNKSPNYYIGDYLFKYLPFMYQALQEQNPVTSVSERTKFAVDSVDHFIKSLVLAREKLEGREILVFEVNGYNEDMGFFTRELDARVRTGRVPKWLSIEVLDVSQILRDEHFYILDDHLRASGHKLLAKAVATWLLSKQSVKKSRGD